MEDFLTRCQEERYEELRSLRPSDVSSQSEWFRQQSRNLELCVNRGIYATLESAGRTSKRLLDHLFHTYRRGFDSGFYDTTASQDADFAGDEANEHLPPVIFKPIKKLFFMEREQKLPNQSTSHIARQEQRSDVPVQRVATAADFGVLVESRNERRLKRGRGARNSKK